MYVIKRKNECYWPTWKGFKGWNGWFSHFSYKSTWEKDWKFKTSLDDIGLKTRIIAPDPDSGDGETVVSVFYVARCEYEQAVDFDGFYRAFIDRKIQEINDLIEGEN